MTQTIKHHQTKRQKISPLSPPKSLARIALERARRAMEPEELFTLEGVAKLCLLTKALSSTECRQLDNTSMMLRRAPFRQTGRKYMSKRSGQRGQVFLRNERWVGRYYVDLPGDLRRKRRALVLGAKQEMTRSEAKRKLLEILTEEGVNTSTHLERSLRPPTTFVDVTDAWESKRLPQLKESSRYTAPRLIAKYLRPWFGSMALELIKTGAINDWIVDLQGKGLEPKTIHNLWKMFRAMMNWHSQQNDEPPRKWYPSLPMIPNGKQRWFSQEEIGRIVEAAEGQYKVLFHLAGTSGLRFGELAGLHVEDMDLTRGVIRVERSVWRGVEVTPKTRNGFREVWIDSGTTGLLREYLGTRAAGRVFQTKNGTPLENHNVVRQVLKPICKRLGILPGAMHAFRHGRVSHLQAMNVPPDFTKSQVGHSSLRTTSGYTHFSEDFKRETVERVAPSWTH